MVSGLTSLVNRKCESDLHAITARFALRHFQNFGRDRICQMLVGMFQLGARTSAQVLGLYGMTGLGKTTICKALCNYVNEEFLGRVCYIEVKEKVKALERQRMVMKKLLRIQRVCDVFEGWKLLQSRLEACPVFLVIDNVQFDVRTRRL